MLTTLTLPKEYDSLPLLTRLWLQSRVVDPAKPRTFLPPKQVRPVTLRNAGIAIDMVCLLWGRLWASLSSDEHRAFLWHGALFVIFKIVDGIIPPLQYTAVGRLLALAERSLSTGKPVPWSEALCAGALAVSLTVVGTMSVWWFQRFERQPMRYLEKHMTSAYLRAKLGETHEQEADPIHSAILAEAAVKGNNEFMMDGTQVSYHYQGPFDLVHDTGNLLRAFVGIVGQSFVVMTALTTSDSASLNIVLLWVFLMPMLIRLFRNIFVKSDWEVCIFKDSMAFQRYEHFSKTFKGIMNKKAEISVFGLSDWLLRKWEVHFDLGKASDSPNPYAQSFYEAVSMATFENLVWVLLATRVVATSTSLASLTLLQASVQAFGSTLEQAAQSVRNMVNHIVLVGALYAAIDNNAQPERGGVDYETIRKPGGVSIDVRNLSVTYAGKRKPAISGVNLSITAGETLAIVGYNGSGKTTLVKTLLGLVPFTGDITVNGVSFPDIERGTYFHRVSCIFQEFVKYPLTVGENIGIGDVRAMDDVEGILTAVKRGGAEQVVERVPLNALLNDTDYTTPWMRTVKEMAKHREANLEEAAEADGTVSDEKGDQIELKDKVTDEPQKAKGGEDTEELDLCTQVKDLSGGEWQRIALARAFMGADRADLVVFDEPTSALDPRAESDLFDRLYSLSHRGDHKCTTIFISHGFGNVRRADKIAFMEDGAITEYGTHAELMVLGGKYCELFSLQRDKFTG